MPTIFKIGPYRFFFYSGDSVEPIHVHVERDGNVAKFWVEPVRLQNSGGFPRHEINKLFTIVEEKQTEIIEAWNEYFSDRNSKTSS